MGIEAVASYQLLVASSRAGSCSNTENWQLGTGSWELPCDFDVYPALNLGIMPSSAADVRPRC
jgi:hypothetical protein